MKYIDLRSDTVTAPTPEMREAMYKAEVGDDVYGDDPTVRELEEYSAFLLGKQAALYVPSGTFGNQLSLLTNCRRGDEVILEEDCHIVMYEAGAPSVIAGVQLRTLRSCKGELNPVDVEARIRGDNIHYPRTGLICLENAHSNGRVIPLDNMKEIWRIAQKTGIPVHLDGARIFNAASYLGVEAAEIATYADSVMVCLSKGLCAPVGSIVAGTKAFIDKARRGRKLMGGGLRQSGILAAAGLVALKEMRHRLAEDREVAMFLGEQLSKIPGVRVNMEDIHINMVYADISESSIEGTKLANALLNRGIKINPPGGRVVRMVTHNWITMADAAFVAEAIRELI